MASKRAAKLREELRQELKGEFDQYKVYLEQRLADFIVRHVRKDVAKELQRLGFDANNPRRVSRVGKISNISASSGHSAASHQRRGRQVGVLRSLRDFASEFYALLTRNAFVGTRETKVKRYISRLRPARVPLFDSASIATAQQRTTNVERQQQRRSGGNCFQPLKNLPSSPSSNPTPTLAAAPDSSGSGRPRGGLSSASTVANMGIAKWPANILCSSESSFVILALPSLAAPHVVEHDHDPWANENVDWGNPPIFDVYPDDDDWCHRSIFDVYRGVDFLEEREPLDVKALDLLVSPQLSENFSQREDNINNEVNSNDLVDVVSRDSLYALSPISVANDDCSLQFCGNFGSFVKCHSYIISGSITWCFLDIHVWVSKSCFNAAAFSFRMMGEFGLLAS
ncbi:OLC1v1038270C1 [Oldenlandia corymbosa var. corymbosa]|uniref:OLC1v1038270C1 n=1 Tax=Oldenlandia corymbosa var. corymbosa TaxID=529605 RepID=A0AAV1CZD7_OLDCO|nr:OLC1v1038270C1 [Oldenlandia corymbosa var. corymbosa]